jgi:glycosidase
MMPTHRRKRMAALLSLLTVLATLLPALPAQAATVVATVAGNFQSEIGCPGDWQPACDLSLMSDPDGDGVYTFSIAGGGLPVGDYEYKVALDRAWNESYPSGNLSFRIAAGDNSVRFSFDSATNAVSAQVSGSRPPAIDGDIFWDGLGHNSRDALYRLPGGAVTSNQELTLRFRTFHNDATGVTLRTYHTGLSAEQLVPMARAAQGVSCGDAALTFSCDFWSATINSRTIGTLYYRFIVSDGAKTVLYEDDSDVRDGGWGQPFNPDDARDRGWVITVYDPNFKLPLQWMKQGVVYQIFPDRFRNGDAKNDPKTGDVRYDDPAYKLNWGELPEGYCRNYLNVACPWRFDDTPPDYSPNRETGRGRDYYGGDLKGVTEKIGYLKQLGVTVIYFNPIFAAGSNHRYDTRDYKIIDPYLGDLGDFQTLEREAAKQGIRIILDGVFNHMSSDSPAFDRYGHYATVGACESESSPYRAWFRFRKPNVGEPAACAPYTRDGNSYYDSWAGFDSIPALSEVPAVKDYIYSSENSVARSWIKQGADGWRLDVMQDKSIPFWEGFRQQVKSVDPNAIIIGELWKKFDVLPYINGNTADTAMNYRLRDAVLGLLTPGSFDGKGFPGSGAPITPSAFRDRLESVREDYPDATYYTLMNLLDSHDTERLLWTLTPGQENTQERELNAANVAEGKQRQRLAALIQMTMPGAPTIYYGDEVALTGDDDPDDRRTYPWGDSQARRQGDTRQPDQQMLVYYQALTKLRANSSALVNGDLRFLLTDDASRISAYGRKAGNEAVLVAVNASKQARTVTIPVAGYLPNGTRLAGISGGDANGNPIQAGWYVVQNGAVTLNLPALGGGLLVTVNADLTPTAAPTNLSASADGLQIALSWSGVAGASGYNVYRSPVNGGGYVKLNSAPITGTSFTDASGLLSGQRFFYIVKALDSVGNESAPSNEASATPSYKIGWANLQWPPTLDYTISAANTTDTVYGQVYIEGVTSASGATPGLLAQLGYGAQGSDPRSWTSWTALSFNVDAGNNDEFKGALQPTTPGVYSYFTRYSTNGGASWTYGDLNGIGDGSFAQQTDQPGALTVRPAADTTAPAAPTNLQAFNGGATAIALSWTASTSSDVFRYDIYRSTTAGGGYAKIGAVDAGVTQYADANLQTGTPYFYVVRALDAANNVSSASNEASATPAARAIHVTFEVSAPATTPADGVVYIVGNQPQICNWCSPQTITLTKGGDGKWRTTIDFLEGTEIEYKFTLGSWERVEKTADCNEVDNRRLRVTSSSGDLLVQSAVANWRGLGSCPQ